MKQTLKKSLSIILATLMLICSVPVANLADIDLPDFATLFVSEAKAETSGACGENLTWSFDETTGTLIISGTGNMYNFYYSSSTPWYSIKSSIKKITINNGVTEIEDNAFSYCTALISIEIPDSVTFIGTNAFFKCTALTSIEIPDSVTSIGQYAFHSCAVLTNIEIPDSITNIREYAFHGTGYYNDENNWENGVLYIGKYLIDAQETITDSYKIKKGTAVIAEYAFYRCSYLTSIEIPNSVTNIGYASFYKCTGLANVYYNGTEEKWDAITIENYNEELTNATIHFLGESSQTSGDCGENLTWSFDETTGTLTISGTGEMYADIGYDAPWYSFKSDIKNLVIEDGVTNVADNAFPCYTSIEKIELTDSIITIGSGSFTACSGITDISLPQNLKTIGDYAFSMCSELASITIPDSVKTIGEMAFSECENLTEVTIGKGVENISQAAFSFCAELEKITVDSLNESYSSENGVVFNKDKSKLIFYPIGCTNTEYEIPSTVSIVCEYAFIDCENLEDITIPSSVTMIGTGAFGYCDNLTDVHYIGTEDEWNIINIEENNDKLIEATIHFEPKPCEHNYVASITTPATCTENGVETFTCTECGDAYTREISATGHTQGSWITSIEPACDSEGEKVAYCTECGVIVASDVIPATGHTAGEWETSEKATCTEIGEKVKKCVECGEIVETDEIPATGHTAGNWITILEPTTEAEGKKVKKCTVCGETFEEEAIAKLPKEPVKDSAVVSSPSTSTINYGDAIVLHVDESKIPEGGYVGWTADNSNFSYNADGATCTISPEKSGDTTFTATIYDADGNPVSTDEQTMTSKAGFFQKIIAFFKGIFGLNKTYPNIFKF